MTAKTLAERSASYRQRKAERVARMEAALRQIAIIAEAVHYCDEAGLRTGAKIISEAAELALKN